MGNASPPAGQSPLTRHLMQRTLALVLAGGSGSRLKALTEWHAKPALPFAGHYRNIDFSLSNCVNSGIRRIAVLTQYKAHSLIQHLARAWNILQPDLGEFIELWPAQQRCQPEWYTGTANAVFQNLDIIDGYAPDDVLVLAGDHVYRMDYGPLLYEHARRRADVTVGCVSVRVDQARELGVLDLAADGRIEAFLEKPSDASALADVSGRVLASMGIYVFSADYLRRPLEDDACDPLSGHDFGRNVIPAAVSGARAFAYRFLSACGGDGYWRDVGTVDAYWSTNLELLGEEPPLDLGDPSWPIRSYREPLPPARVIPGGSAEDSMVADGCLIRGLVRHSVLFPGVHVVAGSEVRDSVVLPHAHVGRGCRLHRVVVASGCRIPDGTVVGENPVADRSGYHVTQGGVTLICGSTPPGRARGMDDLRERPGAAGRRAAVAGA